MNICVYVSAFWGDYFFLGMFRNVQDPKMEVLYGYLKYVGKYMEIYGNIFLHRRKKQALYMIGTANKSVPDMAMIAQKVKLTCFWVGQRSPDSQLLLAEVQFELLKPRF